MFMLLLVAQCSLKGAEKSFPLVSDWGYETDVQGDSGVQRGIQD